MPNTLRLAMVGATIFLITLIAGCGGSSIPQQQDNPTNPQPQLGGLPHVPAPQVGVQMPVAPPLDEVHNDKAASAVYRIFFRDAVNQSSGGRWTVDNNGGAKAWTLSNTFFSSPKAWVIGQNYWNNEDDDITSTGFDVEDGADGLAVTFYARYNIASGDHGTVFFWDGTAWQQVVDFTAGSNTSYPAYDKFYFQLPANTSGMQQSCNINFHFESNSSGTNWGFGVDSVAVYQTQLGEPLNLDATDGANLGEVDLSWSHNNVGNLTPGGYDIYRADDSNGAPDTYAYLDSEPYPTNTYTDITGNGSIYWYKVVSVKTGWPDSPESNEDSGYVIGTWMNVTVDSNNDTNYTAVTALASGNPCIAYYDPDNDDIRFAYSSQPDGSSGWADVLVDGGSDVGLTLSLAIINGNPAVSYYDNTNSDLKYAYSSQADGSSGWTTVTVDGAGDSVGTFSSLLTVNGFPAISYTDNLGDLMYAYSSDLNGADGTWTPVMVDGPAGDVLGYDTSLAVINGFPAISHGNNFDSTLNFSFSSTVDGNSGWSTIQVGAVVGQAYTTSLATLASGNPAISYTPGSSGDLSYAYSSTVDGTDAGDWTTLVVETTGAYDGQYTSLEVPYGKPAIGSQDNTNGDLKYAYSSTTDGSSGWTSITVDTTGIVGEYCNMTLINGKPAISYRDQTNTNLKYAWLD